MIDANGWIKIEDGKPEESGYYFIVRPGGKSEQGVHYLLVPESVTPVWIKSVTHFKLLEFGPGPVEGEILST